MAFYFLLTTGCGWDRGGGWEGEQTVETATLVETQAVRLDSIGRYLAARGTVEALSQVDISAQTSGRMEQILVEEGDLVRVGSLLGVIRNESLGAGVQRAQAELNRSEEEVRKNTVLLERGAISERDLQDATLRLTNAQTSLLEAAAAQSHSQLTSPIEGVISLREAKLGEIVSGQRLFQVVNLDQLVVTVKVPEKELSRLKEGLRAELRSVYDEEQVVQAELTRLSPTVDPTTGTLRATLSITPGQSVLRPGQYVSVQIELERRDSVLVIPKQALTWQAGRPGVFRVRTEDVQPPEEEESSKGRGGGGGYGGYKSKPKPLTGEHPVARWVPVEQGFVEENKVEILAGLEEGDEIIVIGQTTLRDGSVVRRPEEGSLSQAKSPEGDSAAPAEEAPGGQEAL